MVAVAASSLQLLLTTDLEVNLEALATRLGLDSMLLLLLVAEMNGAMGLLMLAVTVGAQLLLLLPAVAGKRFIQTSARHHHETGRREAGTFDQ